MNTAMVQILLFPVTFQRLSAAQAGLVSSRVCMYIITMFTLTITIALVKNGGEFWRVDYGRYIISRSGGYKNNIQKISWFWHNSRKVHEHHSIGTYMQEAGYRTAYLGKYLNEYEG